LDVILITRRRLADFLCSVCSSCHSSSDDHHRHSKHPEQTIESHQYDSSEKMHRNVDDEMKSRCSKSSEQLLSFSFQKIEKRFCRNASKPKSLDTLNCFEFQLQVEDVWVHQFQF
jgi:hypothetical protein